MAATADRTAVTHQSLALVNHLARVSRRGSEEALAPLGLRPLHLVALTLLRDHGSATQQALAEALRIDASNLVGLLNDLERDEFLVRQRDQTARARGPVTSPKADLAGTTGTHPSIHGHLGAPPKGVEMSRFKIMIPKRSDERKENIEAGKGEGRENNRGSSQHDACSRCGWTMGADGCSRGRRRRIFLFVTFGTAAARERCYRRSARRGRSYTTPAVGRKAGIVTGSR